MATACLLGKELRQDRWERAHGTKRERRQAMAHRCGHMKVDDVPIKHRTSSNRHRSWARRAFIVGALALTRTLSLTFTSACGPLPARLEVSARTPAADSSATRDSSATCREIGVSARCPLAQPSRRPNVQRARRSTRALAIGVRSRVRPERPRLGRTVSATFGRPKTARTAARRSSLLSAARWLRDATRRRSPSSATHRSRRREVTEDALGSRRRRSAAQRTLVSQDRRTLSNRPAPSAPSTAAAGRRRTARARPSPCAGATPKASVVTRCPTQATADEGRVGHAAVRGAPTWRAKRGQSEDADVTTWKWLCSNVSGDFVLRRLEAVASDSPALKGASPSASSKTGASLLFEQPALLAWS